MDRMFAIRRPKCSPAMCNAIDAALANKFGKDVVVVCCADSGYRQYTSQIWLAAPPDWCDHQDKCNAAERILDDCLAS